MVNNIITKPTNQNKMKHKLKWFHKDMKITEMNTTTTKPELEELRNKYVGKLFKYNSKYGGTIENIMCEDISVADTILIKKGDPYIESYVISIISDKRNVYLLNEVEFYDI